MQKLTGRRRIRKGAAVVAMVVVLVIVSLIIVGLVLGGARDQDLTIARMDTIRAFYSAEAGMNMAMREIAQDDDIDGDGGIGTISDDGVAANDPALGSARVHVTDVPSGASTLYIAMGTSGAASRRFENTVANASGQGAGLRAEYFQLASSPGVLSDIDWTATPTHNTLVSQINFAVTSGQSWPGGPTNYWGRRYVGKITIPQSGSWTFYTNSDDGSRLWINGSLIVDNDGVHSMQTRSGSVSLTAGTHDIEIQWFERTGVFGLIAYWRGPGVPSQTIIPASALSH